MVGSGGVVGTGFLVIFYGFAVGILVGWSVPAEISSLSQLQYLYLDGSGLSQTFPWKSLQNMTGLVQLYLGNNPFNPFPFPKEVLQLTNLTWLYLSNCSIHGTIPAEIGNLKELIYLRLWGNNMTGKIPVEIGNLVNLRKLSLSLNSFIGKLPVGLRNLTKLKVFHSSMNNLEGDLSELRFLNNLVSLRLCENELSGQVPAEFGEFKKLVNLSLCYNSFTGPLPQNLGSSAKLYFIKLSMNSLPAKFHRICASKVLAFFFFPSLYYKTRIVRLGGIPESVDSVLYL
ncbi:hypothetical protein SO802_014453 [Lithocarpus litseifolius]|uniref:Disease resistance R13L4/SHOC-2-like LRR domain-containing protein n=1 Tax=Lithocarpus litseifolius TaxID=425828 RepID=A0AAW2CRH0_9ROSI